MTTFDDRERAFETKFARDEELAFRIVARRNRLLGQWAAELMKLTPAEADAYAKTVVHADLEEAGDDDVVRKVLGDLGRGRGGRGRCAPRARGADRRGAPPASGSQIICRWRRTILPR